MRASPLNLIARATRALIAAAVATAAASPAHALPTEVYWQTCGGAQSWTADCWTNMAGRAVGRPVGGQSAYVNGSSVGRADITYRESGDTGPLTLLELGRQSFLTQTEGTLAARQTRIAGTGVGSFTLTNGSAQLGDLSLGGHDASVTGTGWALLDVRGGRLDATQMQLGLSNMASVFQSDGRVVVEDRVWLHRDGGGATYHLSGGRLEASRITATGAADGITTLRLTGGTLALRGVDLGPAVRVDTLTLADGFTLTLGERGADNTVRGLDAGHVFVGDNTAATLIIRDDYRSANAIDRLTVRARDATQQASTVAMASGDLLVREQITIGRNGLLRQTGGALYSLGGIVIGDRNGDPATVELHDGLLYATGVAGNRAHSSLLLRGGSLDAGHIEGLGLLHVSGGAHNIDSLALANEGVLELDGDSLAVAGLLELDGTLRLLGERPELDQWVDLLDWGVLEGATTAAPTPPAGRSTHRARTHGHGHAQAQQIERRPIASSLSASCWRISASCCIAAWRCEPSGSASAVMRCASMRCMNSTSGGTTPASFRIL